MTEQERQGYIKKREIILKILSNLIGHWDFADGLYALVRSEYITRDAIDGLENIINNAMKDMKENTIKEKMQKSIEVLKRMKKIEEQEKNDTQTLLELKQLDLNLV